MKKKSLTLVVVFLFFGMMILPTNAELTLDDNTPPVTTVEFIGTFGENDWYVSDVTIILTATDEGSGVNVTYYSFDEVDFEIYKQPIVVWEDGEHIIYYYSVDVVGNIEPVKEADFKIDQTPPIINDLFWDEENKLIIVDVDDETSGVAKVEFYINDEFVGEDIEPPFEWYYPNASGSDTVQVIAYDFAGNAAISEPPPPPPSEWPVLYIGTIKNRVVNNETTSFYAKNVICLAFCFIPINDYNYENVTVDNDYFGFIGNRFIFALFWE